jgi:hypothetical protein
MTDDSMPSPRPVVTLDYANPTHVSRWVATLFWMRLIALAICIIATLLIPMIDVKTVLGTGPTLFVAGALMLVAARQNRDLLDSVIAAGHLGICLLFFGLVHLLHWGPGDATTPFLAMGAIWCVIASVAMLWRGRMQRA